jgi:DNA-binding response OmpR family regulator
MSRRPLVVVIEDDDSLRALVAASLEDAGFRVVGARTAGEGVALCVMHGAAVVVVDERVDELDGLAVCTHLRSDDDTRHSGIVLVSAEREAGRSAAADAPVLKPFAVADLVERVRALADQARATG